MVMIRRPRRSATYVTAAFATAFIAGISVDGLAQVQTNCSLDPATLEALASDVNASTSDIAIVLVLSLNDIGGTICTNPAFGSAVVAQDDNIGSDSSPVDILAVGGATSVLTQMSDAPNLRLRRLCFAEASDDACVDVFQN